MGYHFQLYKSILRESERVADKAKARNAASGMRDRAQADLRDMERQISEALARARLAQAVGAQRDEAFARLTALHTQMDAVRQDLAVASSSADALATTIQAEEAEAARLLAESNASAAERRDAERGTFDLMAKRQAADAEAGSHRSRRASAEAALPFERQAREVADARVGPAQREAREAVHRLAAAMDGAAAARAKALQDVAEEAARLEKEALDAVRQRALTRREALLLEARRKAEALTARALEDERFTSDEKLETEVEEARSLAAQLTQKALREAAEEAEEREAVAMAPSAGELGLLPKLQDLYESEAAADKDLVQHLPPLPTDTPLDLADVVRVLPGVDPEDVLAARPDAAALTGKVRNGTGVAP